MPTKVYQNQETAITWDSGAGDELLTLTSLLTLTGRQGAYRDYGTAARADRFAWRAWVQFDTNPVVGQVVRIYIVSSDGTSPDNDDGTGDVAVSAEDKLRNLRHIGSIIVDEAVLDVLMVASGEVFLPQRWNAPVFWNATEDSLRDVATVHGFSLTPIPMESQ